MPGRQCREPINDDDEQADVECCDFHESLHPFRAQVRA